MLGVELGLPVNELSRIKKEYAHDSSQAFTEMLLIWLTQGYNVAKDGAPTWRRLVEAVDSDGGGNNHALAKMIAANHPMPTGMYTYIPLFQCFPQYTACTL